jgi:hypothetical protein
MSYFAKLSNKNCTLFFQKKEQRQLTNQLACFDDPDDSCEMLEQNTLLVSSDAFDNWEGFDTKGETQAERVIASNGESVTISKFTDNKELIVSFNLCKDCGCWTDKINCILSNCCEDYSTVFEFMDNCGRFVKLKVDLNNIVPNEFDGNCGIMDFLITVIRQTYIERAKPFQEYPTYTNKIATEQQCGECIEDCYSFDVWNKVKQFCFNANVSTVVFTPQEQMDDFILIWNNNSYKISMVLAPFDTVEIIGGYLYLNGVRHSKLSDYGINLNGSTTSNGLDCIRVETPGKKGILGVIEYEKIETCKNEIWEI